MKEFRLKKKINNLAWDSVKVSITRSFWNSYNIPAICIPLYTMHGINLLSGWILVSNNVRLTLEQK